MPQEEQENIDKYLNSGNLSFLKDFKENDIRVIEMARNLGVKVVAVEASRKIMKKWLEEQPHLRKFEPIVVAVALSPKRDEYVARQLQDITEDQNASVLVLRGDLHTEGLLKRLNKLS